MRRYCYRDVDGADRGDLGVTAFNARTDSFVTLLLNVSGRARPSDIQGVSPAEALEVLQAYAAAHAAEGVRFDGDALVIAAMTAPVSGTPASVAFETATAPETSFEPQAAAAPAAEQLPSWMFEGEAPAPVAPVSAPDTASIPEHESALFEGVPAPQLTAPGPVDDGPIANDFVNLPPLEDAADAGTEEPARKRTSPLLLVLLVVLVIVAVAAAAYYLGALEMLGLNIG